MHIKKLLLHFSVWSIWCTVTSIGSIIKLKVVPWPPILFNHISLITVFYSIYLLVYSYKSKMIEDISKNEQIMRRLYYYLCRWQIVGIILVLFGNIAFSWYMDYRFCDLGYYDKENMIDNFWIYADGKFARESLFASTGAAYGLYRATVQQKNTTIEFQKEMLMIAKRENINLKGTIKRLLNRLRGGLSNESE